MKKSKPIPRTRRRLPVTPMPPREPLDVTVLKARRLPMYGPDLVIRVPLHLLPAYMEMYVLVPMTLGEVRDTEKLLGRKKPADVVWVKRVKRADAITAEEIRNER